MSTDAVPMSLSARLRARRHGFTLLELIVVLIVLAVLSLIAVPTYAAVKDRARDAAKEVELNAIMRDAMAIAKSHGASYPTQAEVDTAANEAQLQSEGVFAAVDGVGDRDSLIDTLYPDAGWQYLIDYGPSLDPTVVSYAYDGSVATNSTLGWAMRSTSGHCVFGRSEGTSVIETWIVGEDLQAGCAGTPGLEGPSGTFNPIPTTTTTTTAPNNPPVAVDDAYNATAGVELAEPADGVLANDTDPDAGDTLTVISNTDPAHGSATVASDGSFTYTADLAYAGDDTFDYTIDDGNSGTDTATVTVTVAPALGIWNPDAVDVVTVAGSGTYSSVDNSDPLAASFKGLYAGTALNGVVYIPEPSANKVRSYNPSTGAVGTAAGTGTDGCSSSTLKGPLAAVTDGTDLFVADSGCGIRSIDTSTGTITNVSTSYLYPQALVFGGGYLWTTDGASTLYRVDPSTGATTSVTSATTGVAGYYGIAGDDTGLWVADSTSRVYKVAYADALAGTVAGGEYVALDLSSGTLSYSYPLASAGDYLYGTGATTFGNSVIRIDKTSGELVRIAGTGFAGFADGHGYAAQFNSPHVFTADGKLYVGDTSNYRLRRLDPSPRVDGDVAAAFSQTVTLEPDAVDVVTAAGDGTSGFADNADPLAAKFKSPYTSVVLNDVVYVADLGNHRIRTYDLTSDAVGTLAGDGTGTCDVNSLKNPVAIATDDVRLYIADSTCGVYQLDPATGIFARITTTYTSGGIVYGPDDHLWASNGGSALYRIDIFSGVVETVASSTTGVAGYYGITGDATDLWVAGSTSRLYKVAYADALTGTVAGGEYAALDLSSATLSYSHPLASAGDYLYGTGATTFGNSVIRIDKTSGELVRIAGTGFAGFTDGHGYASQFNGPRMFTTGTAIYASDTSNYRLRRLDPTSRTSPVAYADPGVVRDPDAVNVVTVAGDGTSGFADNADPLAAKFVSPRAGVVLNGVVYIPDSGNHRIRTFDIASGAVGTLAGDGTNTCDADSLKSPLAMSTDGVRLYATDSTCGIYQVDPTSGVFTLITYTVKPSNLTYGYDGNLYAAVSGDLVQINLATGVVTTVPHATLGGSVGSIYQTTADSSYVYLLGSGGIWKVAYANVTTGPALGIWALATNISTQDPFVFSGGYIYMTGSQDFANSIVRLDVNGILLQRITGTGFSGYRDGHGYAARFNSPKVFVGGGDMWVADTSNRRIRRVDVEARVDGTLDPAAATTVTYGADAASVVTVAGDGTSGFVDSATPLAAEFAYPYAPAAILNGVAYIPDVTNHRIRSYDLATGAVGTLAGDGSNYCDVNSFKNPFAVSTDGVRLYVADSLCGLYQLDPASGVFARLTTDYMPSALVYGTAADIGMTAPVGEMGVFITDVNSWEGVYAVALQYLFSDVVTWFIPNGASDPLYGKTIYSVAVDGTYLWMAANDGLYRSVPGSQNGAYIDTVKVADVVGWVASYPIVSAGDYIYAASGSEVYRITKTTGATVRVAGDGTAGFADGVGTAAQFNGPKVFVGNGHVYVADSYRIRRLD